MSLNLDDYSEAHRLTEEYLWSEAAEIYSEAADALPPTSYQMLGALHEAIGYCYSRAAYQSTEKEEFRNHIQEASRYYEAAYTYYGNSLDQNDAAKQVHCDAQSRYLKSWLCEDPHERKELLDTVLVIGKDAVEKWSKNGDPASYHSRCNEFLTYLYSKLELVTDHAEIKNMIEEALECGEAVLNAVEKETDATQSTLTRYLLSIIFADRPMSVYESVTKQQVMMQKSLNYAQMAYTSARGLGDLYLVGRTSGILSYVTFEFTGDLDHSCDLARIQLETVEKTRDTFSRAQSNELLAYLTLWKTNVINEDPEILASQNSDALKYAEEAILNYDVISKPITYAYMSHSGSYHQLAKSALKPEEKHSLFKRGYDVAKQDIIQVKKSGSPIGTLYTLHQLAIFQIALIPLETDYTEKRSLLADAESTVKELIDLSSRVQLYRYWNQSIFRSYSALLRIEESKMERDPQKQLDLLLSALAEGEECVRLGKIHLDSHPSVAFTLDFAIGLRQMAGLLSAIYQVTEDPQYIERSIVTYREILQIYTENDLYSSIAETNWALASIYNRLGRFQESAREFEYASTSFGKAAEKTPHLEYFYLDYQKYMKAWSEINYAKYNNILKEYIKVKLHYQNAADIHNSTNGWKYLYNNYLAWARLAEAEDYSQNDDMVEAKRVFEEIIPMFEESKNTITAHIPSIGEENERLMALSLVKASEQRKDYCNGRIMLEEAKILDRQGAYRDSSRKFDDAGQIFENIADKMETKTEKVELLPIVNLCKAWRMMMLAEAEASPNYYHEAALFFEQAKDQCIGLRSKMMAQGHINFCLALYECNQFESTRDMSYHQTTKQYLNNAVNFYVKAGYTPALEYSKATQRLLDAYVYMNNADNETDPEQKARYYMLAERVLKDSAELYLNSNYLEKSAQVNKLLENVQQEQRLALSLVQILEAPIISSSTTSFNAPTPTQEYAVGIENFDRANLLASVYLRSKDVKRGVSFNVSIVLFNTGRVPAYLLKVEDIVSPNFEVMKVSGFYGITDQHVDLKGKKLSPLSTEEISLVVKPLTKGSFTLEPCLEYVDETGNHHTCQANSVDINVKETGILDWLRGPRM